MKKQFARVVLCLVLPALAGIPVLAQNATEPGVITINGGRDTVALHALSKLPDPTRIQQQPAADYFFDTFDGPRNPYTCTNGYTVSDGSPLYFKMITGSQFISRRTGTTASIDIGLGFEQDTTDSATVFLDKDCKGVPCGPIDKTNLCKGTVKNLPKFGHHCTRIEKLQCVARLQKGKTYWVYVQSPENSWEAWYWAGIALGNVAQSIDDGSWTVYPNIALGAFSVQ